MTSDKGQLGLSRGLRQGLSYRAVTQCLCVLIIALWTAPAATAEEEWAPFHDVEIRSDGFRSVDTNDAFASLPHGVDPDSILYSESEKRRKITLGLSFLSSKASFDLEPSGPARCLPPGMEQHGPVGYAPGMDARVTMISYRGERYVITCQCPLTFPLCNFYHRYTAEVVVQATTSRLSGFAPETWPDVINEIDEFVSRNVRQQED